MDETDVEDFCDWDAMVRHSCIETTKWLLDHSERDTFDLDEVISMAMQLEDYIQGGGTVNVQCDGRLAKAVR